MRGSGPITAGAPLDKWNCVNQVIRENKLSILALQETHLSQSRLDSLNSLFRATIRIIGSSDPENPTGARGVVFAISRSFASDDDIDLIEIVAGRAIALKTKWGPSSKLTIVNVYAPNSASDNATFWGILTARLRELNIRPDVVVGDYNMVESQSDRLPQHPDPRATVSAFQDFRDEFGLRDGYRDKHERSVAFSYLQRATGSQSRIDRAYISRGLAEVAEDWTYKHSGVATDHQILHFSIANYDAPFLGKGRWSIPSTLMNDEPFLAVMKEAGRHASDALKDLRSRSARHNPQTILLNLKKTITEAAKQRAKIKIPKIKEQIKALRADLRSLVTTQTDTTESDEKRTMDAAILQERIAELEMSRFTAARRTVAGNAWVMGETISKYWTKMNAAPKASTVINELRFRDEQGRGAYQYTSRTEDMAEIARKHFEGIQNDADLDLIVHEEHIAEALMDVESALTTREKGMLARRLTRSDVEIAIQESATNKAAGLDGLPAEIWKTFLSWQEDDADRRGAMDVLGVLKAAYNDVEEHGTVDHRFAEGWICPIFKKKDRRDIENYRPITILNTDYKIMTRALANKLAKVIHSVVHPDQAGFVPGRKIFDHIRLTRLVIDLAEVEETDGMIVALDQEKAYDKVNHSYLWKVLEKMNFPTNFIRTIQALYADATSVVMVNGERSSRFRVTRGARQGDAVSCLLFDIAIEPLAIKIRHSSLRGITIPGLTERLIAMLFADDTTVFLSSDDDYGILSDILRKWCRASRAKFNIEKTEYLPIGTTAHRDALALRTSQTTLSLTLPPDAKIVRDGESIRCLGARIGNNCEDEDAWKGILLSTKARLERWEMRNPSLHARKLIVGLEVGGRSQFLTRAQGMPRSTLQQVTKIVAKFMSKGDPHPTIGRDTLYKPIHEGGLGLIDIEARNEAAEFMWLKDYLDLSPSRPKWAFVADVLIARAILSKDTNMDPATRVNCFLQTWRPNTRGALRLRGDVRRMIKTAQKHNLTVAVKNPAESLKESMPIWYHIGKTDALLQYNSSAGTCLREKHGVATVLDTRKVAARLDRTDPGSHSPTQHCVCQDCNTDRIRLGCTNPHRCAKAARRALDALTPKWRLEQHTPTAADNLTLTSRRKRNNISARQELGRVTFNPSTSDRGPISHIFRVFGQKAQTDAEQQAAPVRRPPRPFQLPDSEVEAYTDGSATDINSTHAAAGAGVWFGDNDARNVAVRVPGARQTNQVAELYAVEVLTSKVPPFVALHVVTDSKYVMGAMTEWASDWEDAGWTGVTNAKEIMSLLARLRARSAQTTFRWVKGHNDVHGNEEADKLAMTGRTLPADDTLPQPDGSFVHTSVKLSTITQKLAYSVIRVRKDEKVKQRRSTCLMVDRIIATLEEDALMKLTSDALWRSVRTAAVGKNVRDFLSSGKKHLPM